MASSDDKKALFAKTFYDEVQKVIGGDNSQEKLVLMLPGISLKQSDYAFDKVKSPIVEANESRLANKLYDPAELVGADNGMTLPTQYMSALNALTPKINTFIAQAKNKLRELLIKKYPFTFEYPDGTAKYNPDSTFQEVYFHLYNDYLETARAWAQKQTQKKLELGNNTNEYLIWYQDNAEVEFNIINQKRAKILAIFSPNDMKILEGVLDSGSGAELQEARQMLNNLKKMNPDGSYTYPVSFYPSDWHKYLNTSFTPVDLLNSPEKLVDDIRLLVARRTGITYQLDAIKDQIPDATDLANATKAAREAEKAWDTAFNAMAMAGEQAGINFIITTVKSVCSVCGSSDEANKVLGNITTQQTDENNQTEEKPVSNSITEKVAQLMSKAKSGGENSKEKSFFDKLMSGATNKVELNSADQNALQSIASGNTPAPTDSVGVSTADAVSKVVSEVFNEIKKEAKEVDEKQNDLMSKISEYLNTTAYATKLANRAQLKTTLSMLKTQLAEIDAKLEELKSNLAISVQTTGGGVEPPTIPEGFSQCLITHQMNSTSSEASSFTSSTRETSKKGFWIFKKSSTTSSSYSRFSSFCESDETTISIGMNVAKIAIEREWFNPGLFVLTKNMYSLSNGVKISEGEASLNDQAKAADNILPCYPTALVIARDVTIKITNSSSEGQSFASTYSSETSSSSSFFVFHSGDGTKTESTYNTSSSRFDGNTLTMKFATPQVIGVYLHAIAEDKSTSYPTNLDNEDLSTITRFVDSYKDILDNYFIGK